MWKGSRTGVTEQVDRINAARLFLPGHWGLNCVFRRLILAHGLQPALFIRHLRIGPDKPGIQPLSNPCQLLRHCSVEFFNGEFWASSLQPWALLEYDPGHFWEGKCLTSRGAKDVCAITVTVWRITSAGRKLSGFLDSLVVGKTRDSGILGLPCWLALKKRMVWTCLTGLHGISGLPRCPGSNTCRTNLSLELRNGQASYWKEEVLVSLPTKWDANICFVGLQKYSAK